ncbi:MAG: hypothetical protein ABIF89_00185 [bacterium]
MNWQKMQEQVLKNLNFTQKEWLGKSVDLEVNDLRKMTQREIRARFPGKKPDAGSASEEPQITTVDDARLIRSFIWQSYLMIKAKELKPLQGNLRSFWYRELRPFLKNNNLLETDEGPPVLIDSIKDIFPEEEDSLGETSKDAKGFLKSFKGTDFGRELYIVDKMGKIFDKFVLNGFFRFQDEFEFQDPRESFRIIGRKKPRLIFFTEKEGLFWLCQEISKKYGISAVASHGEPGYLTMEYFSDALKNHGVRSVEIASLTDYDPWGYNIADGFGEKMVEPIFGLKAKITHLTSLDLFTKEKIDYAKRDLTKVSPSKKRQVDEWMKITHGIDGKPCGMHVDLADFSRVRAAVDKWYKKVSRLK